MRHPLILVIRDLWFFVTSEARNCLLIQRRRHFLLPKPSPLQLVVTPEQKLLLLPVPSIDAEEGADTVRDTTQTPQSLSELVENAERADLIEQLNRSPLDAIVSTKSPFEPCEPLVMYVQVATVHCTTTPQSDFDNVLASFMYGMAVTMTGTQGNYAKVFWSHHVGWVPKDALTAAKEHVWPIGTAGTVYTATHDVVKKIRLLIGDCFHAQTLELPLQPGEWVVYRLREQHRNIPWTTSHGRTPGDWQSLLRGTKGIHIGVTPKTDTIMEWRDTDGVGRLAYVEKISPQLDITCTMVGYPTDGLYEEYTFPASQWREFRPVFIEIL